MTSYPFLQVDVFTDHPLGDNPCAVLLDADDLDESAMLAIAREMNLSETAFVKRSEAADFGVRFFTPVEEVPLAGHPTIATVFALVDSGRVELAGKTTQLSLDLIHGPIQVEIHTQDSKVRLIVMTQRKPQFLAFYEPSRVLPVFGLEEDDILPEAPIQTISTGTPQLMIPLHSLDALRRARLDIAAYERLRSEADFFSPHLFCLSGATPAGKTFARHFGTPPDFMEDPFTGSATGGMAAYLWRYGLIQEPRFIAEQGHWMNRPGKATVEVIGSREDIETVKIGGEAITVLRGELLL